MGHLCPLLDTTYIRNRRVYAVMPKGTILLCIAVYCGGPHHNIAIFMLSGWDSNLNGGKLCLYHRPTTNASKGGGEQVTLVAPVGDTLAVFDSHMEHEVLPSFADRCCPICVAVY